MNFILKLKHWQLFIILMMASVSSNFTWEGHDLFNLAINLIGLLMYFFWYFGIGLELTEFLPPRVELRRTLFIVNAFVLLFSTIIIAIVFDGNFSSNSLIGILWVVYLMYAMFQFMFYPSKALKTIELKNEASLGQYFTYFLLIIFWPIGIWWFQPKLNKIAENT